MTENTCVFHTINMETVADHEERLRFLELAAAKREEQVASLIAKMGELMSMIKGLIAAIGGTGAGFIIWYIQSLAR